MYFDQDPYEIKMEWGPRGASAAAKRGDIVIIVDVLSFSSTVVTAVEHGARIYPYPPPINDLARAYAEEVNAQLVWGRAEAARLGGHSLSPLSFTSADRGQKFVMCSLNGAVCTWVASSVSVLLVGCLLNASALAKTANLLKTTLNANITVIPCGEQWSEATEHENKLRPGIEDYLGAGLIMSLLAGSKSPEAEVCIGAYEYSRAKLQDLIWESASGRELRERGFGQDVAYCSQIDQFDVVPTLKKLFTSHRIFDNIFATFKCDEETSR